MSVTLVPGREYVFSDAFREVALPDGSTVIDFSGSSGTDATDLTGVTPVSHGGTGRSSLTPGAIITASGSSSTGMLGPATSGKMVISVGAAPAYSAWTFPASFPKGSMPYGSNSEQVSALLAPAAAAVLVHAGGTGLPSWSTSLARALLPSAIAYEDEANVFTGSAQEIHPAATTGVLRFASDAVAAGTGYSETIRFYDGLSSGSIGGQFLASFSNSAGNRALEFLGGTDRDGARVQVKLGTLNAAGSNVYGIVVGAGAAAGSIAIGSGATPQGQVLVRAVGTILGGATTQYGGFFDTTCASDATVAFNGFYVRAKTPAAALVVPDLVGHRIAAPVLGSGSSVTRLAGLLIEAMTAGTTNFSLATLGGDVAFANAGVKVGIGLGTSGGNPVAPSAVLHVVETSAGAVVETVRVGNQSTTAGSGSEIGFHASTSGAQKVSALRSIAAANGATGDLLLMTQRTSSGNPVEGLRLDGKGNVSVGTAALATNASDGFLYIPTCAGTPTGTPTAKTGLVPFIYDSTNNKLYAYNSAWKSVTLT